MRLTPVKGFRSASMQAWAQKHLRADSEVTSDGLACFRAIVDTCPHWSITTGGGADSMAITEFSGSGARLRDTQLEKGLQRGASAQFT